jgi:UDP-N-acetylglucosamine 2-epimerase
MNFEKHSRIAIVIGTKAELIKCMPLMLELQERKLDYWFIHTGQHPLGDSAEDFGVKRPDFILSKEPDKETKFWSKINSISIFWFLSMIGKIRKIVKKIRPKYVIYHGDTMSTSAAAIGSSRWLNKKKKWKNVHLEAGLRSGSWFEPFPEEISRQISDFFSDILLAVSDFTEHNLKKNRYVKGEILKLGNTIIDSALITYEKSKKRKIKKIEGKYALINIHRHENLKNKDRLTRIVEIIKHMKIKAIWPLHESTKMYLEKYDLMKELKKMKNLEITPLVDYFNFINMLANCEYLVADGGSIQEESLVFKKPCIIIRNKTERQEGLFTGINFMSYLNPQSTKRIIEDIEEGKLKIKKFENPYGKKGLTKKIVDELLK